MNRAAVLLAALTVTVATPALAREGATLRGSSSSMVRQNQVAKANDFSFLRSASQVERFVEEGYLVKIESTPALEINSGVSYPVGRPEMKLFLERLGDQYLEGCGERLVVTSLVRPTSEQPRNSHPLSVHPAGMAADLRISSTKGCRSWLESTLLALESKELLDVTRERNPPHYHIALFPDRYFAYIQPMLAEDSARAAEQARAEAARLAMRRLEQNASALVPAVAAAAAPAQRDGMDPRALLIGMGVVFGILGVRRVVTRRAANRQD